MTDLNTEYRYNIDKKLMRVTFQDGASTLFYIHYDDSSIFILAHDEQVIVSPTWGTDKDINEWFEHVLSCSGRLGLAEGTVRPGYSRSIEVDSNGIVGTLVIDNKTVSDYTWVESTDTLTIAERAQDVTSVSIACFRLYIQWLCDFRRAVEYFGE